MILKDEGGHEMREMGDSAVLLPHMAGFWRYNIPGIPWLNGHIIGTAPLYLSATLWGFPGRCQHLDFQDAKDLWVFGQRL